MRKTNFGLFQHNQEQFFNETSLTMDTTPIENNLDQVTIILKAIANEKRLQIVCALLNGEKSVGTLEKLSDLSQSALSQHLARLRRDDIVETRREAQTIYYSLHSEQTQAVLKCLSHLFGAEYCRDH